MECFAQHPCIVILFCGLLVNVKSHIAPLEKNQLWLFKIIRGVTVHRSTHLGLGVRVRYIYMHVQTEKGEPN